MAHFVELCTLSIKSLACGGVRHPTKLLSQKTVPGTRGHSPWAGHLTADCKTPQHTSDTSAPRRVLVALVVTGLAWHGQPPPLLPAHLPPCQLCKGAEDLTPVPEVKLLVHT
jgi:hypothetical protein